MTLEEEKRRLRDKYNIPDNVEILTQEEYDIAEAEDRSALQVGFQSATRSVVPGLGGLGAMAGASKILSKVPAVGPLGLKHLQDAHRYGLLETTTVGSDVMNLWRRKDAQP